MEIKVSIVDGVINKIVRRLRQLFGNYYQRGKYPDKVVMYKIR